MTAHSATVEGLVAAAIRAGDADAVAGLDDLLHAGFDDDTIVRLATAGPDEPEHGRSGHPSNRTVAGAGPARTPTRLRGLLDDRAGRIEHPALFDYLARLLDVDDIYAAVDELLHRGDIDLEWPTANGGAAITRRRAGQ